MIIPFGQSLVKLSNTLSGHFSAPTTPYRRVFKDSAEDEASTILRKVGVAVRVVAQVCTMRLEIVFASLGSGVYATRRPLSSGIIVLIVKPKLWNGGRNPMRISSVLNGK